MMRRKKESGFTLIELMIVIAVIGILAVVLIPKVGTVKTQAKTAGIDTNMRVVQGYAESQIDKWSANGSAQNVVAAEVQASIGSGANALTNPFDKNKDAFVISNDGTSGSNKVPGVVYIKSAGGTPYTVTIEALDANNNVYRTITVTE